MLFLFADQVAPKKAPVTPATKVAAKAEMGTILELNQEEVLASYKGGTVKRKEVVAQLTGTGMNLKQPQPLKMVKDIEGRLALTIAVQKYVNSVSGEKTLSAQDKTMLEFIKGQFITKRFLEQKTHAGITDAKVKEYYEKVRIKAQKEVVYQMSMCVVQTKDKATSIVNSVKSKAKAAQKEAFVKHVHSDSIFDANKKDNGALPPFTKEKLQQFLSADLATKVTQYAKGSFIPVAFEIKGSYFVFFLDDVKKMGDAMPPVSQVNVAEIRPMLTQQIASENRVPALKQIVSEGGIKVNGLATISDEYLQTAVMP